MKKFALYIGDIKELLEVHPSMKNISEEIMYSEPVNYQDKDKSVLFYQSASEASSVYSVTEFKHNRRKIKETRSSDYFEAMKENTPNLKTMKKTVYKKGNFEFVVQYDHPLLSKPLFFYFIKRSEHVEHILSDFLKFFSTSVDLSCFEIFSEKALMLLSEDDYGLNQKDIIEGLAKMLNIQISEKQIEFINNFLIEVSLFKESYYGEKNQFDQKLTQEQYTELAKKYSFNLSFEYYQIFEKATQDLDYNQCDPKEFVYETFRKFSENISSAYYMGEMLKL